MNTNILDFGAVNGATNVCTKAIQKAIDECAASGGGRVTVPAGVYKSGTLWLRSHVELHLEHGAKLIASTNREDYNALDAYEQNYGWPPEEWVGQHFILAIEEEDVAITGTGTIDGSGDSFFGEICDKGYSYWMHGVALAKDKEKLRPGQLICFVECTNVRVENVTIQNTPCWACFLHGCDYATIHGVKVFNPPHFCNTDGIDIDSCRYVTVSDCMIFTGDDALAVRCAAYRLKNKERNCEYITVTNCVISTCACGVRIGVGKGKIRHVQLSNLTIVEAGALFCLTSGYAGSGHVAIEDVHVQNVSATSVSHPFEILDHAEAGIHDVSFDNIHVEARYSSHFTAPQKGTISNISLRNVDIEMIHSDGLKYVENKPERTVMNCSGATELLLEHIRIHMNEEERKEWAHDVTFTDCSEVETSHCKIIEANKSL